MGWCVEEDRIGVLVCKEYDRGCMTSKSVLSRIPCNCNEDVQKNIKAPFLDYSVVGGDAIVLNDSTMGDLRFDVTSFLNLHKVLAHCQISAQCMLREPVKVLREE